MSLHSDVGTQCLVCRFTQRGATSASPPNSKVDKDEAAPADDDDDEGAVKDKAKEEAARERPRAIEVALVKVSTEKADNEAGGAAESDPFGVFEYLPPPAVSPGYLRPTQARSKEETVEETAPTTLPRHGSRPFRTSLLQRLRLTRATAPEPHNDAYTAPEL